MAVLVKAISNLRLKQEEELRVNLTTQSHETEKYGYGSCGDRKQEWLCCAGVGQQQLTQSQSIGA